MAGKQEGRSCQGSRPRCLDGHQTPVAAETPSLLTIMRSGWSHLGWGNMLPHAVRRLDASATILLLPGGMAEHSLEAISMMLRLLRHMRKATDINRHRQNICVTLCPLCTTTWKLVSET